MHSIDQKWKSTHIDRSLFRTQILLSFSLYLSLSPSLFARYSFEIGAFHKSRFYWILLVLFLAFGRLNLNNIELNVQLHAMEFEPQTKQQQQQNWKPVLTLIVREFVVEMQHIICLHHTISYWLTAFVFRINRTSIDTISVEIIAQHAETKEANGFSYWNLVSTSSNRNSFNDKNALFHSPNCPYNRRKYTSW